MTIPLVLASASPARLATLRGAGIEPLVIVSEIDEDAVLNEARAADPHLTPARAVLLLAKAKALDVADRHATHGLVLGCDSALELDGEFMGKPTTPDVARERWRSMRGRSGVLHTGHWLVDARRTDEGGTGKAAGESSSTLVRFGDLSDAEVDAYVATGEPLNVAGAFTVDGLGGPFVEGIDGDHHGVVGVSLPLMRYLLTHVGVTVPELWNRA